MISLQGQRSRRYTPTVEANINKKLLSAKVDDFGTGAASYQITVSASRTNSYDLKN